MDKVKQSSCYDGWSVDNTGRSVVWAPPDQTLELLRRKLPAKRKIMCIHKMPDGKLSVIHYSNKIFAKNIFYTDFLFDGKSYEIIDEGVIVTSQH